jgi:hypothetical protein
MNGGEVFGDGWFHGVIEPLRGAISSREESSRFLKKAAQKFLLCWVPGAVSDNARSPS